MKKRIVSLVISFCFIIGGLAPCYAADGSSTSPYFVKPESGSFYRYYLGSSGATYATANYTTWGNLFQALTQSIAQSIGQLSNNIVNKLTTIDGRVDGLEGYVDSLESYVDGLESKLDTANVHLDYIEDYTGDTYTLLGQIKTIVNSISSYMPTITGYIDGIEGYIDTVESKLSDVYNAITNSSTDLGTFIPYFMPDSSFDFSANSWRRYGLRRTDGSGVSSSTTYNDSFIMQLKDYLDAGNQFDYWTYSRTLGYVMGESYDNVTYNNWFNTTTGELYQPVRRSIWADVRMLGRLISNLNYRLLADDSNKTYTLTDYNNVTSNVSSIGITDYFKQFGSNITASLGRLAFVLANDQDIALRNNTADQVSALTTNFTGSGSPSKITAGDIGTMASGAAELKSGFSSSANASDAFRGFSTSGQDDRWNWFSQDILNSLDTTGNNNRSLKSNNDFTNFTLDYYNEVIRYAN